MNKKKRILILHRLKKNSQNSTIGLDYSSEFELLIAVLLSAKSTDVSVNNATKKLFKIANTPKKMLSLKKEDIIRCVQKVGLFNKKTKNIIKTCQILVEKYNGKIPEIREDLESFPGIGRKSSNLLLNVIFNKPTIAVDTHIFRTCNRTHFSKGKNVNQMEKKLLRVVPNEFRNDFHHLFIFHGRNVCTARKPKCKLCVIKDLCEFNQKNYFL